MSKLLAKTLFIAMASILVLLAIAPGICPAAQEEPAAQTTQVTPPQLTARAAILLDPLNQQVLLEKNPDTRMYPASTTKMITALLAIQKGNPNDAVTVSSRVAGVEGSVIGLRAGEVITLTDLLYALLLPSANDAAVAIAEHIGGTVEDFVVMMNEEAELAGATGTNFVNPHGLSHPDHYSTARDLAKIALRATQNPTFREIVATPHYRGTGTGIPPNEGGSGDGSGLFPKDFDNTNRLLWTDTPYALEGTTGIKTGYTSPAGRCLVFSVKRGERELLGVLLNSPGFEVYQDARALTEHGFNDFKQVQLAAEGEELTRARIKGGTRREVGAVSLNNCTYNLPLGHSQNMEREIKWREEGLTAPVEQGTKLGQAIWYREGQEISRVDLVAAETVPKNPLYRLLVLIALAFLVMRQVIKAGNRSNGRHHKGK